MVEISESDARRMLIDALESVSNREETINSQALTSREIQAKTGRQRKSIQDDLRELIDDGQVECVWVERKRIDGKIQKVPAYKLIQMDKDFINGNDRDDS